MKHILILVSMMPFVIMAQTDKELLIGKWTGSDVSGNNIVFSFDAEGYASMGDETFTVGGKRDSINGYLVSLTYFMNSEVNPGQIDMILSSLDDPAKVMRILMIYEYVDKDHIKILGGDDNSVRPEVFNEDAITFKRVKQD